MTFSNMKLKNEFYLRTDVVALARELLGKVLVTNFDRKKTSGIITETEAYNGFVDRASHAYRGKRTARNEHMYSHGGISYVYICYGMHHLFNVVTNSKGIPHAILIRAIKPLAGIETMLKRRNKTTVDNTLSGGPGTLSVALGINKIHSGLSLNGNKILIEDRAIEVNSKDVKITPRIRVESAGNDALLPYRFVFKG